MAAMSAVRSDGRVGRKKTASLPRRRASKPFDRTKEAREQFARTFADVLSGRFGGRWSVEWEGADRAPLAADRNGRTLPDEE